MLQTLQINQQELKLHTAAGVFSQYGLDQGSLILLREIDLPQPPARVLDMGCGCGVLGLTVAQLLPQAQVVLMDSDIRAVRLARRNAKLNQLKNVQVELGDVTQDLADLSPFDLVLSNPPTHQGKQVLLGFAQAASQSLKTTGEAYFVVNRLKSLIPKLQNYFHQVDKLASKSGYRVIRARQPKIQTA